MKYLNLLIFCLCLSGLSSGFLMATTPEDETKFSDQVNLALRKVGHQLLTLQRDDTTAVPPVQVIRPGTFYLQLESVFDYDTLPHLLNQALISYKIHRTYHLIVKQCTDSLPILGYNSSDFSQGKVPCVGRHQWSTCNNIFLTFDMPTETPSKSRAYLIGLVLIGLLAGIGVGMFFRRKKSPLKSAPTPPDSQITIGNFKFDPQNQTLSQGEQQQSLTFRENKLLHHLVSYANRVVTRETLNEEIWGDEGVIVGRSLDVFISRLRKLLKGDETVLIKNIHGVGYRLEIKNPK